MNKRRDRGVTLGVTVTDTYVRTNVRTYERCYFHSLLLLLLSRLPLVRAAAAAGGMP